MCPSLIQIGSKTTEKNSVQTNKQTNERTDRQTDTTKIMVTWPWTNSNISSRCPHNTNFSPLTAEIGLPVRGSPANFNPFYVLASLLQRRHSREANQTLHDLWPSPGLVHYIYIFGGFCPDGILIRAKFTLRPSLAFLYISSVTANFAVWYKEWNYGTFAESATYTRLGGHHVGHRPTWSGNGMDDPTGFLGNSVVAGTKIEIILQ